MDTNNKEIREREISLIDLFADILLRWRGVLLSALLGAVLLGAFGYVRSLQSVKVQNRMLEEQRYVEEQQRGMSQDELEKIWEQNRVLLENQLTETQIAEVNTALVHKECYEEKLNYQKNSILMQIDPFHIKRTDLTFLIQTDDNDNSYMIKDIYQEVLMSASLYGYVQEQCTLESGVDELIHLKTSGDGELKDTNLNVQIVQGDQSNVLSVMIIHNDENICLEMAGAVESFIQQKCLELENVIGQHKVILINRSQGEVSDLDVANRQKTCANDLYSMQNVFKVLVTSFSTEQLEYYNYLLQAKEPSDIGNVQENLADAVAIWETPKISVKYIALGAIVFTFVYVAILFVSYILNNKIKSTDNFQELFSIPQLGIVTVPDRKRFLGGIDRWILQLRYHNQRRFTPEESVNLAIVAVKMEVKKRELKQIYLLGCNLSGTAEQLCERIKAALGKEQIEVVSLNNVLYDAEAMEKLENAEAAVLVETSRATLYDEIAREIQLLRRQKIEILGGVLIG